MRKSVPPSPPIRTAPRSNSRISSICRFKGAGRPSLQDTEALADHLLDTGWELLLETGFERFSFDRLARFARVGKPTIYARFANKEAFLRAMLIRQIERRQREIIGDAQGRKITEAMPVMAMTVVEMFQSAEGRLIDRLIDWLDHETSGSPSSLREWAMGAAIGNAERLLVEADQRGEICVRDPIGAARFFVEGIAGHARIIGPGVPFNAEQHRDWARQLCAMILDHFGCGREPEPAATGLAP